MSNLQEFGKSEEEEKSQPTAFISCDHSGLWQRLIGNWPHRSRKPKLAVGQKLCIIITSTHRDRDINRTLHLNHDKAPLCYYKGSGVHILPDYIAEVDSQQHAFGTMIENPLGPWSEIPSSFSVRCEQYTGGDLQNKRSREDFLKSSV